MNKDKLSKEIAKTIEGPVLDEVVSKIFALGDRVTLVSNDVALHLDTMGSLWKFPKERYCYDMKTHGAAFTLLHFLFISSNKEAYHHTDTLTALLNAKFPKHRRNNEMTRDIIKNLKKKIKQHLKLVDVIEGRSSNGYRINPKYEVNLEK